MEFQQEQHKIIKKFELLSERYHKLSLLFYELSQSLKQQAKRKNLKEFKEHIKKDLNLDLEKLKKLTITLNDLELEDLQKEQLK